MMTTPPANERTLEVYSERLTAVLRHIDTHLDRELPPASLARVAHFSPFHFQRLFSAAIGEPLCDYIRRRRLDRAASQLRNSSTPIITIAAHAGYASQTAFTRAFRARFAISPKQYRKTGGPDFWHATPATVQFGAGGRITPHIPQEKDITMMQVDIQEIPRQRIATIKPSDRSGIAGTFAYGEAAGQLLAWAVERGIEISGINGIDRSGPVTTADEAFTCQPAIPLPPDVQEEDWFQVQHVGGGLHVVASFRGKPQALAQAYEWLYGQWLPASGYEPEDRPGFTIADCPPVTPEMVALEEQGLLEQQMMSLPDSIELQICIPVRRV